MIWLGFLGCWYAIGMAFCVFLVWLDERDVTVNDIACMLVYSLVGPILILLLIGQLIEDYGNTVVFKRKRKE